MQLKTSSITQKLSKTTNIMLLTNHILCYIVSSQKGLDSTEELSLSFTYWYIQGYILTIVNEYYWLFLDVNILFTWWQFSWYLGITWQNNLLLRKVMKCRQKRTKWFSTSILKKFMYCNKIPRKKICISRRLRLDEWFLS